ncbi:hypothetical protein PCE1_001161 [Barthelona sp. PCE]
MNLTESSSFYIRAYSKDLLLYSDILPLTFIFELALESPNITIDNYPGHVVINISVTEALCDTCVIRYGFSEVISQTSPVYDSFLVFRQPVHLRQKLCAAQWKESFSSAVVCVEYRVKPDFPSIQSSVSLHGSVTVGLSIDSQWEDYQLRYWWFNERLELTAAIAASERIPFEVYSVPFIVQGKGTLYVVGSSTLFFEDRRQVFFINADDKTLNQSLSDVFFVSDKCSSENKLILNSVPVFLSENGRENVTDLQYAYHQSLPLQTDTQYYLYAQHPDTVVKHAFHTKKPVLCDLVFRDSFVALDDSLSYVDSIATVNVLTDIQLLCDGNVEYKLLDPFDSIVAALHEDSSWLSATDLDLCAYVAGFSVPSTAFWISARLLIRPMTNGCFQNGFLAPILSLNVTSHHDVLKTAGSIWQRVSYLMLDFSWREILTGTFLLVLLMFILVEVVLAVLGSHQKTIIVEENHITNRNRL